MEKSTVYFTDLRTSPGNSLPQKMKKLVRKAGIGQIDFKDKFTAIKIHFGEPGNVAYIRHNYAAALVDILKELGAKVFLTDSNTLYSGGRSNAVDHLKAAMDNGFNPISAHADVIIADGLKGTDYKEIELNGEYCKAPKLGAAIADADIIISMNHFKGHEQTGFGGALKNLGMGSASVGGKLELHSSSQPVINLENCIGCRICEKYCRHDAVKVTGKKAHIDYGKCVGCGQCVAVCQHEGAVVKDSILMGNVKIGKGTKVEKAIIAEDTVVGDNCDLGVGEYAESKYNQKVYAFDLVTIGENSVIPDGVKIGKNTAISGVTEPADYPDGALPSGGYIIKGGEA